MYVDGRRGTVDARGRHVDARQQKQQQQKQNQLQGVRVRILRDYVARHDCTSLLSTFYHVPIMVYPCTDMHDDCMAHFYRLAVPLMILA